ncbi:MAG: ribosome assembly RNA-binding protein YhbY [Gammaproteobacteria bacterium]|nr:ribosome assembly RNA-binding protein YhbY [Gammaproteobacteria bacterium]
MSLNDNQIRFLRKQAHSLKPVVLTGQHGITEGVLNEIDLALEHHELIKVRISASDREERKEMINEICEKTSAELIQSIGHIAALFRQKKDRSKTRFTLPK